MVTLLWKILPTRESRLVVVATICVCMMLILGYRFVSKVYKHKYDIHQKRILAVILSIAVYAIEVIIVYNYAKQYWYNLGIKAYFKNTDFIFILCLLMIVAMYTVHKVLDIFLNGICELRKCYELSMIEYIYMIIHIICLLYLTNLELSRMEYLYNNESGGFYQVYIMCMALAFLGINVLLSYGFKRMKRAREYEKELVAMRIQCDMQFEKYKALNDRYEASGKVIHDIKKHLNMLETLMDKDNKNAKEYKEKIGMQINSLAAGFVCSNRILSVIMSQKLLEAEEKRITVNVDMMDVELDFVDDIDITSIFANMWDNAIEATSKVEVNNPYINIVIGKVMEFIIISFENSFNGVIKTQGEKLLTSKAGQHGLGLKIIREAAKKYGGEFNTEVEGDVFKAQVILPVKLI